MVIRKEQMQAFTEHLQANLEQRLFEHCYRYAPRLFHAAGESGIRQVVRLGIRRAQEYGLRDEPQVRLYIDTMLVLGSDFDTDPQFTWAAESLRDSFSKPHVRGLVLHRDLSLYLDRVMGPGREYVKSALNRFAHLPHELPPQKERSITSVRGWLQRLFPQKSEDVNNNQLTQISAAAARLAGELGIASGEGLLAGVMLVFGHGVTQDSLYPWISNVLRDPRIIRPEARLERLWAKLRTYAASASRYLVEAT